MKLIALSDTHLKTGEIPPQLQTLLEECDLIVHAGTSVLWRPIRLSMPAAS